MASTKPVSVLEICHVSPSSTSPESSTELSLPLIFSDIFNLKFPPVQGIFFYKLAELTPTFFNSVILPKVKHSLSLTLSHFRPLAGNLTWPANSIKPVITYNTPDDGIKLTVAESSADFDHLCSEVHDAIESHHYVPSVSISDTIASTLAIQITLFPNKGFCIGHTTNHAVLDGLSASFFMNAWARICRQLVDEKMEIPSLLPEELTPFFNRTVFQDPEGLDMWYLNFWLGVKLPGSDDNTRSLKPFPFPETPPNLVRTTFELSREDIQQLRETVKSQLDNFGSKEETNQTKPIYLSTYVLVYAYTLVCMLEAKGLNSNDKIKILITVDCRPRLNPPLPKNYIGNCVSSFDVVVEGEDLMKENGVAYVAKRLTEMIKGLENRSVFEGAKERLPYNDWEPDIRQVRAAGTNRFGMYGADFGWGKPSNVEVTTIDRLDAFSIMESKDESGGVEVGLVLKEHEMKLFGSLFASGLRM
ncbi:phenolic glucoside malonyltransferase 1 isoform X3 [Populus trichocarpa]|uniref:phenolic glucoside malonyltransferase 1 isoform X3 n=1 Tax=Populus trichocarpa TaxID=3694 RepID=UPI0022791C83|nr:phenolic glucoside malonyltransferase 1 isoform X3 [Populus trichocarpa]